MPTDVNNLKGQQRVRAEFTVTDTCPNDADIIWVTGAARAFPLNRADIITDWPPEPGADEAGWKDVFPAEYEDQSERYEYRVQRRPLAPKWVPTVGEDATYNGGQVAVRAIDGDDVWVTDYVEPILHIVVKPFDLTQPKEGGQ